jgi:nucleoside 2-deoxyribosyltransferase
MPFATAFDDVYDAVRLAVQNSVTGDEVHCFRLSELQGAGRITERLVKELNEAVVCIADITGLNANVMWEVGYAMALAKPTLLISQDRAGLPFDLKDMHTVFYIRDALAETLRKPLA